MAETKASDSNQIFSVEMVFTDGTFKASGTRVFINEQLAHFNERLAVKPPVKKPRTRKPGTEKPLRRRGRPRMKHKLKNLPPLDLKGSNDIKSLKAYVKGAKLRSNYERCTLYLYYLQKIRGRKTVVHNELSECFSHLGIKPPANIQVCLSEAKRKHKFVDMPGNGTVKLGPAGVNLVEKKLFE